MVAQHANFNEFSYYALGLPADALARRLRCTPATARAWQSGQRPVPWWAVNVLRLDKIEREEMARQMGYAHSLPRLGLVRGEVIRFPTLVARPRIVIPGCPAVPAVSHPIEDLQYA